MSPVSGRGTAFEFRFFPLFLFFFFQAEDGIRDLTVTGVQTCALPIYHPMGGKFFRNHINFHHTYYSKDHLVSQAYLGDEGNNTPFFFIPVFLAGACTYLVLPVDLFVVQVVACAASFYAHVFFDKEYHVEGSRLQRFAWFRRKQELHFVHHRHANSNFAVIHFFWDRILGTYRRPDAGQTQTNGTLRIGGLGRFPPFEADSSVLFLR